MRLGTIRNGKPDGELVVVSSDMQSYLSAEGIAANLQQALENWLFVEPALRRLATSLDEAPGRPVADTQWSSPLPRAWQWLDGSAFPSHGELMDRVLGVTVERTNRPLMYQGVSDRFYGPTEDVPFLREVDGIDFEGEFAVITDFVPAGTTADQALSHIKLLAQVNDWSLRKLAGPEMKTGFGWVQAKPPCSAAPFVLTPDELGANWKNGRITLDLLVELNGARFGRANGEPMEFGFHDLVAHAAGTRDLVAGTIIGSGTVSNPNYREIGSSCIAERRGIEIVDTGSARTEFMQFGDRVRMAGITGDGSMPFGAIDQAVVRNPGLPSTR